MQTYEDTPERRACGIKPTLSEAYHRYASTLAAQQNEDAYKQSIEANMSCLEEIGMKITDRSISGPSTGRGLPIDPTCGPTHKPVLYATVALHIVSAFAELGEDDRARNWMKVASWSEPTFSSLIFVM